MKTERPNGNLTPVVLTAILSLAVAVRAWLLFSTPFMPGVNGAYYLIQTRALLDRGTLGLPDMPLTFGVQAALAGLLAWPGWMASSDAILLAVKLCDAVLPVLVALPVFLLIRRWAACLGRGDAVPLVGAALSVLALPWLLIVGELQKNSLALVFLALLMLLLRDWLQTPARRRGAALLACLVPLGLTHIGVLGVALVLVGATLLVFGIRQGRQLKPWDYLPWILAGLVILAATSALVAWKFDSSRIERLATALSNPSAFASDGRQGPAAPSGESFLETWWSFAAFSLAVFPSLVLAWRRRRELEPADLALIVGSAVTVLMITGPWFGADKELRFSLIALLPTLPLVGFAVLHLERAWLRRTLLGVAVAAGLVTSLPAITQGGRAVLDQPTMEELGSLAPLITDPARTTIVTEHGAEWWCAWLLRVHIAQAESFRPEDREEGEDYLFLDVKTGRADLVGRGGPPSRGPPPDAPKRPAPPLSEVVHDGPYLRLTR